MFTFNGTGTRLYGHRDEAPDGSYIATKWLVVLFLPMLPLGSYRVVQESSSGLVLYHNTRYRMVRVPLHWRQVLITYAVSLFVGPFLLLLMGLMLAIALFDRN